MRATLAALVLVFALAIPSAAAAATITVDTTEDVSVGQCTLRSAIRAANFNAAEGGCTAGSGADTIEFSLPPESTITLGSQLPSITSAMDITGPGIEELTVSGGEAVAAFIVNSTDVSISGLTVLDTRCLSGCAIVNFGGLVVTDVLLTDNEAAQSGSNASSPGGAIYNSGSLEVVESELTDNVARATGPTGNSPQGGAIANSIIGELTIVDSILEGNQAVAEADSVANPTATTNASGGAIVSFGKLTIRGSTLSGNSAIGTGSSVGNASVGGALASANAGAAQVVIERSTITGNSASAGSPISNTGGGGISADGGTVSLSSSTVAGNSALAGANLRLVPAATVRNTIVAEPLGGGQNCSGALTSQGFNLDEGTNCGFNQATDQSGVDPLLASSLADNGGPTPTLALLAGSPAIDQGLSGGGETSDQRELPRPVDIASVPNVAGGDGADIGAFEVQVPSATITAGPADGATIAETEPTFEFESDEATATFECSLDGTMPAPCTSPFKLLALGDGPHTFGVVAISPLGYAGPAVTRSFTVQAEPTPGGGESGGGGSTSSGGGSTGGGSTGGAPQQATAPETTLGSLPARTRKRRLKIRFSSSLPGSTFACKLDGKAWRSCGSPLKTPKLAFGKHTIRVRATSAAGVQDPTPAKKTFRVLRPPASR